MAVTIASLTIAAPRNSADWDRVSEIAWGRLESPADSVLHADPNPQRGTTMAARCLAVDDQRDALFRFIARNPGTQRRDLPPTNAHLGGLLSDLLDDGLIEARPDIVRRPLGGIMRTYRVSRYYPTEHK